MNLHEIGPDLRIRPGARIRMTVHVTPFTGATAILTHRLPTRIPDYELWEAQTDPDQLLHETWPTFSTIPDEFEVIG